MFDITSSKLLILAIVALLVVGPKDLPLLLRTVGKYLGVIRRHANEFRSQLDEAIREVEMQELRKELEGVGNEMKTTMEEGAGAIDSEVRSAREGVDKALEDKGGAKAAEDDFMQMDYRTEEYRAEMEEDRLRALGRAGREKAAQATGDAEAAAAPKDEKAPASDPGQLSDKTGT